jgi:hypothetical protein
MNFLLGAWNWIKNPNNKGVIQLVFIVGLVAIILMQHSCNGDLKKQLAEQKAEYERQQNNVEALKDTIRQGKINDTTLLAEKLALKLTLKELKEGYSDMLIGFEQFKKQNPKVIEKITVNNYETIREVPVYAKMDSLGNGTMAFIDTAKFADGNYRNLKGVISYSSKLFNKKDSSEISFGKLGVYNKVTSGVGNFVLDQGIKLKVGLFEDPKTHKVSIAATTSYPGIKFTQLEGADIMDDNESKKATKQFRRTWGVGLSLGYGATVDLKTSRVAFGPQVGVGLHYTPKWLQWGK